MVLPMPQEQNDNNEETTHLSEAELRDLVVVCLPAHDTEAFYLISRLEEAGIPAAQIADTMRYPGTVPDIRVPRALLGKAKEVVDTAREEAKKRALSDAQETTDVDEKDMTRDPVLIAMTELQHLPMEEKRGELILRTIDWFAKGKSDEEIARYLAVAGLTPDETHGLVREIQQQHQARLKTSQVQQRHMSFALIFFGILVIVAARVLFERHTMGVTLGFLLIGLGMVVMYASNRKVEDSALAKEPESKK
jgi:hypothetical protein